MEMKVVDKRKILSVSGQAKKQHAASLALPDTFKTR